MGKWVPRTPFLLRTGGAVFIVEEPIVPDSIPG